MIQPVLAPLKLHYLRWLLFPIGGDTYFMYQGIFDTDFDKYTEDAVAIFSASGITTTFENLEGFPEDWKENPQAFVKFVREHQVPSFLEYGEYPYVSADEIKKALRLKASFSRCSTRCSDHRTNENRYLNPDGKYRGLPHHVDASLRPL